jgi:hypothetical protein
MENFFYEDKFYSDVEELMIDLEIDEESIESMPDFYKCYKSSFEPIFELDADWVLERIDEERQSEDGEELDKIQQLLKQIDFSKFNEQCPKLYYPTREKFEITKADLYAVLE